MFKKNKPIILNTDEDLQEVEEDIINAANKAGKKNIIVNIFTVPKERLKRRWNIRYKFNKKHLFADIMIAVGVLFLIGLNIFWFYGGFHYFFNRLEFSARLANEQVISGASTEVIVEYSNHNKFEVEEAVLSLVFPKFFVLESVDRANYDTHNNVLVLGDLAPGANGKIVIKGKIYGSLKEQQAVFGSINYFKTNKKGDRLWGQFRKNTILEYAINSSPLVLTADFLPGDVIRGELLYLGAKIKNTGEEEYKKLSLNFMADSEVTVSTEQNIEILNLKPGEEREIKFDYKIDTGSEDKEIKLQLHWLDAQWDLVQAEWSNNFKVKDQKFTFVPKLIKDGPVNPGDWVDFVLDYHNAGAETLSNVGLSFNFIGDYWDLSQIKKDGGNFYPVNMRGLSWTDKELPELALLQPGESGSFKISVKTKSYVPGSTDLNLKVFTSTHNELGNKYVNIQNEPLTIKLNSNLAVQVYPVYYAATGDQLGRGPLPPKVGETTKYWIFAKLLNDISPVKNVVLSMQLPFNVSWDNRSNVPVGDPLKYDPDTRTISWQVTQLPVKPTNIGFAFEVGIIPTASQLNQNPVLIQNIRIQGIDERTGVLIEKELGNITTKLIQDTKGKLRDGVVR